MKIAGILTIGDELIQGFTVNSNAAKISKILIKRDIDVKIHLSVPDNIDKIIEKINKFIIKKYDFIIITGGLGPTHDDVTKKALMQLFNSKLKFDKSWHLNLEKRYKKRKLDYKVSKCQSEILEISNPIENKYGTALGMEIISHNSNIFILPGVPLEMEEMLISQLNTRKINVTESNIITINTTAINESELSKIIFPIIKNHKNNFTFSFLPNSTGVKIRIKSLIKNFRILQSVKKRVINMISNYAYSEGDISLEEVIASMLIMKKYNLSIAESCTGGLISKSLTDISGSSTFFNGSIIAYNNEIKQNILNIDKKIIRSKGEVSPEVSELMAINIAKKFNTNISISCTGISGPTGGTIKKPIGLVYVSIYFFGKIVTKEFIFISNRKNHRAKTKQASLYMLWKLLNN